GLIVKLGEQAVDELKGIRDGFGPKEYTGKGHDSKGQQHLAQLCQARKKSVLPNDIVLIYGVSPHKKYRNIGQGMEGPPKDKGPVRAVPEPTDQKYKANVPHGKELAHPESTQRNINVMPEPS